MEKEQPINCWCGREANVYTSVYSHRIHVSCSKTDDHVPWSDGYTRTGGYDDENSAIRGWNRKMQQMINLLKLPETAIYVKEHSGHILGRVFVERFNGGQITEVIPPEVEYNGLSGLLALHGYTPVSVLDIVNYREIEWEGIEYNRLYRKGTALYRFNEWFKCGTRNSVLIQEIGIIKGVD